MFAVGCMRADGYKGRGRSSGPSYLEHSGIKIRKFLEYWVYFERFTKKLNIAVVGFFLSTVANMSRITPEYF